MENTGNILPGTEAAAYHTMLEDLKHSKDWPKKVGSFAVPEALNHKFANKAEDGLRREFNASAEVTCSLKDSGFTEVRYQVDYSYATPESFPQVSDIIIDPVIEAAESEQKST